MLELRVGEIRQLYNALDPAPFRERDLDPNARNYIVEWAKEARADESLGLRIYLSRESASAGAAGTFEDAVHTYFNECAQATRRRLRRLLRTGRISLVIGLAFLAGAIALGEFLSTLRFSDHYEWISQTLVIGGWVALWRPLEIFLYDWWPIRSEARLYDRLAVMPVEVTGTTAAQGMAV